ncbi:MAG: reductive dehalogenase [Deltaproteobacteria bacterium]|nr:reductive dehalogenase [Deltaproteobacteria bacterium]MBW2017561.1 reductive dehalogenase [Deltaproteobacteria bacterium]MBW2130849.1 reductive dehalogenase [Deltaproteobacteria bacterium]MBW2302418.1 reductive dehalogenase [Deltaproteobacteria bacterium]
MTRIFNSDLRDSATLEHPDPFPVHKLKRVDRPTTFIDEAKVQRVSERDGGFYRAGHGEFGPRLEKEYKRFVTKHPLSGALDAMTGYLGELVEPPKEEIDYSGTAWGASSWAPMPQVAKKQAPGTDDPQRMARHIKEVCYFLRADLVGICKLPPYAVFSHRKADGAPVECNHKYAIAVLVDQDWRTSSATNGHDWISNSMSFLSYSTTAFITCIVADYIRRLGYPARAHHAMNYQVVVPPILLWAGLGEMCRIGDIVLNPFLGPRFKAGIITTDLPLAVDKPIDFGLQDFCSKCGKCARECPSQAISYGDKEMYNGYMKWMNDVEKCTAMRVGNPNGSGCGTCIKVCPWNKPYTLFHRAISWTMTHVPFARRFGIWGDDLMGYGKADKRRKWWLDFEEIDGELRVPSPPHEE